jgi:Tfp pilus assembly protein PilO
MKKQPNPKLFIALTAATLVVGGGLAFFQYSALQDTQTTVAKLRKDALDESQLETQLKDSLGKLQQCSARLNHLEKGVPELAYVPTMLKELEGIGRENGLEVLGVRPVPKVAPNPKDITEKKAAKKRYSEVDIEVNCRGNYKSVKNFVRALQSFPKIVAARTISMTPKQDTSSVGGSPKLDVTISLRSYLFPPDKSDMKKAEPPVAVSAKETKTNAS